MRTPRADSSGSGIWKVDSMAKSGITQKELVSWGGAEVFNQGLAICNRGEVLSVSYNDETLEVSGKIDQPSGWEMPVSFFLQPGGRIQSKCPCRINREYGQVCAHVLALGIALMVKDMDEVEEPPRKSKAPSTAARESARRPDAATGQPPSASTSDDFIEVPMKPVMYALVSGSRAALSIEIDAHYREIEFPAASIQSDHTVYLPDPDDPLVRRTRSIAAEREALKEIESWGFAPGYKEGDLKLYTTDQQKVLNFLGAGLPALRRRGWRIDLSTRLMDTADDMPSIVPIVTIKDAPNGAFDVAYQFDAMGHSISPIEVQGALNRGDGYIMKDGAVVLLDNKAIEEMHDIFRDCSTSQDGAPAGWFRVKSIHAPYVKSSLDELGVELDDHDAPNWRENATEHSGDPNAKYEPVSLGHLDTVLRPYQKQGVYWMRFLESAGHCGLLADEMGLGKTLQTLTWLSLPRLNQQSVSRHLPALIVCPTSLVMNWKAEARKFVPDMKVLVISGPDRADSFKYIDQADIVVTSYALIQRDFEEAYMSREFSAVVLDEAQRIKNRQTKNAKAVKMLSTYQRLVLTGTPVENSVADVWSIFNFLMPEYLGEYEQFKLDYEQPILDGGSNAQGALERLKRKLRPFILRRVKKTVAKDLPDKIIKVSYCPLSEGAQREYNEAHQKTRREAGDLVKAKGFNKCRFELLAMLMKLRQISSAGKLEGFLEQLQSAIEGGHKILVFSQFVKTLQMIAAELQIAGIKFCYLDGATKDRLGECNRFNKDPSIPVFLISLMAGGTGLNLTSADMVIHYDPWWNPAVEDQATDRAHRIGQKKNVYVMKMIASGTVEEKVLALQRRKQAVIAATVNTTDAAVMETLTAEDLNTLLS